MADSIDTLKCPACGEEMTKVFIADKGINIDVCANNCGGIFLTAENFNNAARQIMKYGK